MKLKFETPRTLSVEEAKQMLARVKATGIVLRLALLYRQEQERRAERESCERNLEANVY